VGLALGGAMDASGWERRLRMVEHAERLGLHSVWLPEGHFSPGATASPLVALAAFAVRSQRLRLGTTSLLLPIHHPLRVATEVALLDGLSGGRVILGVGRGFRTPVFEGFGLPARGKRDRFDAALDVIETAWSGEPIHLAGDHFAGQVDGQLLRALPRPVQEPHPPVVVAAFGAKGLRQAARRGLPYLASPLETLPTLEQNYALHREHLSPQPGGQPLSVPVMRTLHVSASDAETASVLELLEREWGRRPGTGPLPNALARAASGRPEERALIGCPAAVAEGLARYRERLGMDLVIVRSPLPSRAVAEQQASLERLVGEVLPRLNGESAPGPTHPG
jgi:alkanesulfonate monooxygenase SsuD/methylene tetrahydromethanopterin reductase-like flavin-dependent oxidoreductase (luciferase family)